MLVIEELKKVNLDHNHTKTLNNIKIGGYFMSVQCGNVYYSDPRFKTSLNNYKTFELALFNSNNEWINIRNDKFIKEFSRYEELISLSDGWTGRTEVFAYVHVDLLNDLYLYLKTQ